MVAFLSPSNIPHGDHPLVSGNDDPDVHWYQDRAYSWLAEGWSDLRNQWSGRKLGMVCTNSLNSVS